MTLKGDGMDVLAKDAQRGAFGMPSEQCTICGMPAPHVKATSKEAQFQNEYGIHYVCARDAKSPEFQVFEKNFKPLADVAQKKREQAARAEQWAKDHPEAQAGAPAAEPPAPDTTPEPPKEEAPAAAPEQAPASTDEEKAE